MAFEEAKTAVSNEIKRCVSNGWYKQLLEMEKMAPPKDSKKAVRDAIEAAAIKEIELCAASNQPERIIGISKDKALSKHTREMAGMVAGMLSSDAACKGAFSGLGKDNAKTDFLKAFVKNKEKKEQNRFRRLLRL